MTAQTLLSQLRDKGIQLKISGTDRLVVDAPKGTLTPELRNGLTVHKAEILKVLQKEQNGEELDGESKDSLSAGVQSESSFSSSRPIPLSDEDLAQSYSDEIKRLEEELSRLSVDTEARRAEAKTRRAVVESSMALERERQRKVDEESARQRAQEERRQIEAEERERAEEANRRRIADHELARAEEELKRMRATEQKRRGDVELRLRAQEDARLAEIEARRVAEEERERDRADEERQRLEAEARERAQEEEALRRAEIQLKILEEEIARIYAREEARRKAAEDAARKAEDEARQRIEEEARRKAQAEAQRKTEEEARLRARIEAELRAESEARRRSEEEARRKVEEEQRRRLEDEARRRAEEEARRLAADEARRRAQEEVRRRAEEEEARRRMHEDARRRAEEEALRRAQAEDEARRRAEAEATVRAEEEARQRAELEARIRAEIEAKIRAEEEAEQSQSEEHLRPKKDQVASRIEEVSKRLATDTTKEVSSPAPLVTEVITVADDVSEPSSEILADQFPEAQPKDDSPISTEQRVTDIVLHDLEARFPEFTYEDLNGGFQAVSVPDSETEVAESPRKPVKKLTGSVKERVAAISKFSRKQDDESFEQITAAFDDSSAKVRDAAARALFEFQNDRAAAFTRALREASPERRQNIGAAIASSGLANEAIGNLTGESREKTYDAFSLLFLMSKAGEVQPLMRAIEEHPSNEIRLAVVKLLALSGQPSILPAFRRMAVRGMLPPEVRSAVMESIYQMTSQSSETTPAA
jgi:TubC N-terminal docking domain